MLELTGEVRLLGGLVAGRYTVQALLGDEHLFTVSAETEEEAFSEARRRLQGNEASPPIAAEAAPRPTGPDALPQGAAWSRDIQIQPRAQQLPIPLIFHLEEGQDRRRWDTGNGSNAPSDGHHQVDPRREGSWAPTMPDIRLARSTGNAYPTRYDPRRMDTTPAYRELVIVSHIVCRLLRDRGSVTVVEITPEVIAQVRERFSEGNLKLKVPNCIRDTLRDLRLYGLARTEQKSRLGRARFTWVPPESVALAE